MAKRKRASDTGDEAVKKSVQELLEIRKEHEKKIGQVDKDIEETLQEEFHEVWEDRIRPALERFKETADELLHRFSDFEDDFRGYLRDREPDVKPGLLAEIYGDSLKNAFGAAKNKNGRKRRWSPEVKKKLLADFEKAKEKGQGAEYLKSHGLTYNHITNWKRSLLKAAQAAEGMTDKP
ncbi:hypothetical protein [Roseobacter ponti]|uniref:Transposase n=1 Tax=Roseobacter ponti TaxID=1891787 RepID=A0A858SW34_9RHOB|nr:hypothetical protein [Roseobacter ponti]QJF51863.1 hypothetical protein G3256_12165 [Roseobacter ponti]